MSGGANLQRNLEFCGDSKKMQGDSGALDWEAQDWECHLCFFWGPNPWWLGSKKNSPAMWETKVPSLGGKMPWKRAWQPTPVSLPGKFQGQRRLAGYSPWGFKSRT